MAHGHAPETVDAMCLRDLELLAAYAAVEARQPFVGEG